MCSGPELERRAERTHGTGSQPGSVPVADRDGILSGDLVNYNIYPQYTIHLWHDLARGPAHFDLNVFPTMGWIAEASGTVPGPYLPPTPRWRVGTRVYSDVTSATYLGSDVQLSIILDGSV